MQPPTGPVPERNPTVRGRDPDGAAADPLAESAEPLAAPPARGTGERRPGPSPDGFLWRLRRVVFGNPGLLAVALLMLVSGAAVLLRHGPDAAWHALGTSKLLFLTVLPALGAGVLLSALARALLPRERVSALMGAGSGIRGLLLAAGAGLLMPGGPMAAFPMVLALGAAGADVGAVVAFVLSWALNGLQRILVWELPLLGAEFAAMRFVACLPLPILAGLIVRRLPFGYEPPAR